MRALVGSLSVVAFMLALGRLGVDRIARQAVRTSNAAVRALRDRTLTERDRESLSRQASASLAHAVVSIGIRGLAALAAALVPILIADLSGLAHRRAVVTWLASPGAIILATAIAVPWFLATRRS